MVSHGRKALFGPDNQTLLIAMAGDDSFKGILSNSSGSSGSLTKMRHKRGVGFMQTLPKSGHLGKGI